jgi:lysophospholipase L1-like esterase
MGAVATIGEIAVRARERKRTTVPGTMPLLYYRHGRLGHALVRNYDYFGWVHVDGGGFRGRDVSVEKAPGVLRILVLGGSTTFDTQVSRDDAAWPARMQAWLGELAPNRPVEVINAGVPGYTVMDNLIRLQTELFRYQPDLLLLYDGHNDLFGSLRAGSRGEGAQLRNDRPGEVPAVTPWGYWLGRHSLLYGKLVERFRAIGFRRLKATPAHAASPILADTTTIPGLDDFERDVSSFVAVARSLGIRTAIAGVVNVSGADASAEADPAVRRTWSLAVPFASPSSVLKAYAGYNGVLRSVSNRERVPFIATAGFGLVGSGLYAEDDPIHFNDRGADRMGEAMARALLGARLLDPR